MIETIVNSSGDIINIVNVEYLDHDGELLGAIQYPLGSSICHVYEAKSRTAVILEGFTVIIEAPVRWCLEQFKIQTQLEKEEE